MNGKSRHGSQPPHEGFDAPFLDDEEREIIEEAERGGFVPVSQPEEASRQLIDAARNALRRKPVTLRLQEKDIRRIKVMALEQGIPCQTLISSIIHQYANGHIKSGN